MANFFTRLFSGRDLAAPAEPPAPTKPRMARGAYVGAAHNRLNLDWNSLIESPDTEASRDLWALRGRARDLTKNNAYAARFLELMTVNVVGPHGVNLQCRVRNAADELDQQINATLHDSFTEWGKAATIDGKLTWLEVQQLVMRSVAQDGEVFVRLISAPDTGNRFGFALQVIDADYLDLAYYHAPGKTTNAIIQGVEVDQYLRPIAYHFFTSHPSGEPGRLNNGLKRVRIPATEVVHLYRPNRPNQTRGIPWLAPAMSNLKLLGEVQMAELVAMKTSAAKMGFIKTSAENASAYLEDPVTLLTAGEFMEAQPGMITRLDPGDEFVPWTPDHPSTTFDSFTRMVLRGIAASVNVSYSALSHDYSTETFSAARLAHQEQVAYYRVLQQWLIHNLHERVYAAWVTASLKNGALPVTNQNPAAYMAVDWKPRGFDYYDPTKEVTAIEKKIALGLTSRTLEAAKEGRDIREVFADLDRENQLASEFGIDVGGIKPAQPTPPVTNATTDPESETDGETADGTPDVENA